MGGGEAMVRVAVWQRWGGSGCGVEISNIVVVFVAVVLWMELWLELYGGMR